MLEVYTNNAQVASGATIPLSNVTIIKGTTAELVGANTINLNKSGVYAVSVDAFGYATTTAGVIGLQLLKDGVLQPQAISTSYSGTANVAGEETISFQTLVQVDHTNTCCCCTAPTTLTIENLNRDTTWVHVNVTVTKVC